MEEFVYSIRPIRDNFIETMTVADHVALLQGRLKIFIDGSVCFDIFTKER